MNTDPSHFEDRLLGELQALAAAPSPAPSNGSRRTGRRRIGRRRSVALVGGAVALVAGAAVVGVPFLSDGATPAYAVSANADGTVTVEINSLEDAAGLQRKLREAGVSALVQNVPVGKTCKEPWFTPAEPTSGGTGQGTSGVLSSANGPARFTISRDLPSGQTLVIMTQSGGPAGGSGVAIAYATGTVRPCALVDVAPGTPPFGAPPAGAVTHVSTGDESGLQFGGSATP